MRLNFIGFLSLTIVLISLFLPWWSVAYSNLWYFQSSRDFRSFYRASKFDYSAFFVSFMTLGVYGNLTVLDSSFVGGIFLSTPSQEIWNPFNPMFLLTLTSIFSIAAVSLGTVGCFAKPSWSNQGRKMFLTMGIAFICAILSQLWFDAREGITLLLDPRIAPYAYEIGILGTKQIIVEDTVCVISTYPNTGFYLAVAGGILALIAWRYPKWLHVPLDGSGISTAKWIQWLDVSEREKLATLLLSSLLMSYLLVFLMVFAF